MTLPIPRLGEVWLYLRSFGLARTCRKFFASYIAGQEHWYVTIESLSNWIGARLEPNGLEIRCATIEDLPRMSGFTLRQHPATLRTWCGPRFLLYIAIADGRAVSYRCVSRDVHIAANGIVTLGPDQIYMVDEFTVPEFRRRGITRQLAIATNPVLLAAGYREVVGIHRIDNVDTIAATRAKSIVTIGRLTRTCLASRVTYSYEPYATNLVAPIAASVPRVEPAAEPAAPTEATARAA